MMPVGPVQEISMTNESLPVRQELEKFLAAIRNDAGVLEALHAFDRDDAFGACAAAIAGRRGFRLSTEDLSTALRSDPAGIARWSNRPISTDAPGTGWLPVSVTIQNGQPNIDWAYFGCRPLDDAFFEISIRRALAMPLNRLVNLRTRLADLPQWTRMNPGLAPSGFMFHMSRCGSTLVSQMLAADPRNVVISEAAPIDSAVQIDQAAAGAQGTILAAMIGALGRRRAADQSRYFVKLDSWHTRALPLFRKAFPTTPWVFLFREPGEVLASQMVQPGMHAVPNLIPPALFGLDVADQFPLERYCAAVLGKICEAVLQPYSEGGGLLVNYSELPDAVGNRILPHFGITTSEADRELMAAAAKYDAKSAGMEYARSTGELRLRKTEELRPIAEHYLGDIYSQLELLRLESRPARETDHMKPGKTA
jgi:hypothetical protein